MNLAPIGFGTAFFSLLDSDDFAADNIGKVAENFVITLSISYPACEILCLRGFRFPVLILSVGEGGLKLIFA